MHGSDACLTSMTATTQKLVMAVEYGMICDSPHG